MYFSSLVLGGRGFAFAVLSADLVAAFGLRDDAGSNAGANVGRVEVGPKGEVYGYGHGAGARSGAGSPMPPRRRLSNTEF